MNEGVRQAQRIEETQNLGEETETLILHWMVKNKHNDIVDLGKQDKGWIGQETTHCSVAMSRTRAWRVACTCRDGLCLGLPWGRADPFYHSLPVTIQPRMHENTSTQRMSRHNTLHTLLC